MSAKGRTPDTFGFQLALSQFFDVEHLSRRFCLGLGGTLSLLVLTQGRFETQGKDYTPEGFSASLSGPSGGLSFGVRL